MADPRSDAAIGAALDILHADQIGELDQPFGDQFGMLHQIGGVTDDAGNQDLAVRQLQVFPDAPFMAVAHIAGLERIGLAVQLQHQVREVAELDVVDVRAVAAAPAGVEADAVLRQAADGVVDQLDRGLEIFAQVGHRPVRIKHPAGAELRLVDLQDHTGLDDGLVFLADRVGDRHHVALLVRVVFVVRAGPQAERAQRRDEALIVLAGQTRLHGVDVGGYGLLADIADGGGADALGLGHGRGAGCGEAGADGAAGA